MNESPGKPELNVDSDTYHIAWPAGIEAVIERISEHRDELSAEVTIYSQRMPRPGMLHSARLNLMSTQTRSTLAKALSGRDPDVDWTAVVEAMCFLVRERYRSGEPSLDLREPLITGTPRWLVEPFVESQDATVLFADGGTGKSLVGLAISVTVASGRTILGKLHGPSKPVLYLDWETSHLTAYERLGAILTGCGLTERPPIHYRRMYASLSESSGELRREVTRLGIGFIVVDSLGVARGGEPESADTTIRLFNSARSLGVPWLGIDHVTKSAGNDSTRPFGSTYTHNSARLTWGMDKAQEEKSADVVVSLTNHKRNNGRRLPQQGWRFHFEEADDVLTAVTFSKVDLADTALSDKMPLGRRILNDVRTGGKDIDTLAEELGAKRDQVRARVAELRAKGEIVVLDGVVYLGAKQ